MPKIEAMIAPQIGKAMSGDRVGEILASAIEIVGAENRVARQEVAAAQADGLPPLLLARRREAPA